jgi:hypothetical protein
MRAGGASRVWEIMIKYSRLIQDSRIYFKYEIPEKKLENAIKKYADIPHDSKPLMLIDTALFGSGKEGAVFTEKKLFSKWGLIKKEVPYNSINSAELIDDYIFINRERFFWIGHVDEPNRLKICNFIREIIGMEPQAATISGKVLKSLRKKNKSLKKENEYLKKRLVGLQKPNYMPPEELARLKIEINETEQKYDELRIMLEKQEQEIKTIRPQLRKALEQSEKEKSLLERELEDLHQQIGTLRDTLQQKQIQRKNALDNLTPKERDVYNYILRHKGTVNIAQLMKIREYTAQDIYETFEDLESKGFLGRIVEELDAGRRFTSGE